MGYNIQYEELADIRDELTEQIDTWTDELTALQTEIKDIENMFKTIRQGYIAKSPILS